MTDSTARAAAPLPPVEPSPPPRPGGMGAKALLVSAATMTSRVLGLVRDQLFAALFGAGEYSDAFMMAFRIPNLLRDLFAEGALSAAFVPTFTDHMKKGGKESAFRLANVVITAVLVVTGALTLLGILFAPQIVHVIAPGFGADPGKDALTALCTRIMMPFLIMVALAAIAMGQLNAQEHFGPPAFASAVFNVVTILGGVLLFATGLTERAAVIGWSAFTLLGGAGQVAAQLPTLFASGFRPRLVVDLQHPGLRRILRLMAPAVVGLAATQVNILVNSMFASTVEGATTVLGLAFRLMQLPIGVFGVAVATIATTRLAVRAADDDMQGMKATLKQGLKLVAFFTVPATAGLIILREPIVRLIFQHGRFAPEATVLTAEALLMYGVGLYAYSAVKVAAPAFYALDRSRVPLMASVSAVIANLILNGVLFGILHMPFKVLALGTAAAATVNFTVLMLVFRRLAGGIGARDLIGHFARVCLASAACAAAAWGANYGLEAALGNAHFPERIIEVGAGVTSGVAVYALFCVILKVPELGDVLSRLRRRKAS